MLELFNILFLYQTLLEPENGLKINYLGHYVLDKKFLVLCIKNKNHTDHIVYTKYSRLYVCLTVDPYKVNTDLSINHTPITRKLCSLYLYEQFDRLLDM